MSSQKQSETELQELVGKLSKDGDSNGTGDPAARTEQLVTDTSGTLAPEGCLNIDDGLVKQSLSPLLLLLVGLRTDDAHGKGIMEDLTRFFGADLSPGTVYPALHDLDEDGLQRVAKPQTDGPVGVAEARRGGRHREVVCRRGEDGLAVDLCFEFGERRLEGTRVGRRRLDDEVGVADCRLPVGRPVQTGDRRVVVGRRAVAGVDRLAETALRDVDGVHHRVHLGVLEVHVVAGGSDDLGHVPPQGTGAEYSNVHTTDGVAWAVKRLRRYRWR